MVVHTQDSHPNHHLTPLGESIWDLRTSGNLVLDSNEVGDPNDGVPVPVVGRFLSLSRREGRGNPSKGSDGEVGTVGRFQSEE